jgi:hypothetical protein
MRTPWTLSTIEALVFIGLVLLLAGATLRLRFVEFAYA